MKTNLGQRVKSRRKALNFSQEKLGAMVGLDQTVISKIERGDVQETAKIAELAHALQCDALWLAAGKGGWQLKTNNKLRNTTHPENLQEVTLKGSVPLISYVAAGRWGEAVDNFEAGSADEWIDTTVTVKSHTFALRVQGDSMEPEFPAGTILIVEPELEAAPNDYVIAKNGADEVTFKQLVKDGGDWYLKPLNPRYPIKPLETGHIVGVVRAAERKFR